MATPARSPTHRSPGTHDHHPNLAMELMLLSSRAASSRPLPPTTRLRRACLARPAAGPSNVEAVDATTAATGAARQSSQEWRAGRNGLELELSEEMRRGMTWRMLAPPAAAVAAEAAFVRLLDSAAAPGDLPAWAATAGSAVLFAAGLLGAQYGFLSSRWDATEKGSLLGWDLAVRHWNVMSMAKEYSSSVQQEEDEDDEDEDDDEEYEDEEDDEEESD